MKKRSFCLWIYGNCSKSFLLSLSSAFVYSGHSICISIFFNQTWLICFIKFSSFSVSSIFSFVFIVYWFFSVIFPFHFHFVLFSTCLCLFFINIIFVCFCADLSISWLIFVFLCGYIAGPSSNNILGLVPRGLFVHMYNCYWLYFEYCRVNYTDMLFFLLSVKARTWSALYTGWVRWCRPWSSTGNSPYLEVQFPEGQEWGQRLCLKDKEAVKIVSTTWTWQWWILSWRYWRYYR